MTASYRTMGLASEEETKNTTITCLDGRAQKERQELKDAVEATNQEGVFREIGAHGFKIVFEKGDMCNFPVTIVRYWGEVPTPANQSTGSSSNASPAKPSSDSPSSDAPKEEEEEESEDKLGWGLFDDMPVTSTDISNVPEKNLHDTRTSMGMEQKIPHSQFCQP